jgi:transcriptional regulator with XRE-family HTH domain
MNPTPHTWKDARRLRAWHLKHKGWSQRRIAEALGVSEGAVSQWMTRAGEAGPEALRQPHHDTLRKQSFHLSCPLPLSHIAQPLCVERHGLRLVLPALSILFFISLPSPVE